MIQRLPSSLSGIAAGADWAKVRCPICPAVAKSYDVIHDFGGDTADPATPSVKQPSRGGLTNGMTSLGVAPARSAPTNPHGCFIWVIFAPTNCCLSGPIGILPFPFCVRQTSLFAVLRAPFEMIIWVFLVKLAVLFFHAFRMLSRPSPSVLPVFLWIFGIILPGPGEQN